MRAIRAAVRALQAATLLAALARAAPRPTADAGLLRFFWAVPPVTPALRSEIEAIGAAHGGTHCWALNGHPFYRDPGYACEAPGGARYSHPVLCQVLFVWALEQGRARLAQVLQHEHGAALFDPATVGLAGLGRRLMRLQLLGFLDYGPARDDPMAGAAFFAALQAPLGRPAPPDLEHLGAATVARLLWEAVRADVAFAVAWARLPPVKAPLVQILGHALLARAVRHQNAQAAAILLLLVPGFEAARAVPGLVKLVPAYAACLRAPLPFNRYVRYARTLADTADILPQLQARIDVREPAFALDMACWLDAHGPEPRQLVARLLARPGARLQDFSRLRARLDRPWVYPAALRCMAPEVVRVLLAEHAAQLTPFADYVAGQPVLLVGLQFPAYAARLVRELREMGPGPLAAALAYTPAAGLPLRLRLTAALLAATPPDVLQALDAGHLATLRRAPLPDALYAALLSQFPVIHARHRAAATGGPPLDPAYAAYGAALEASGGAIDGFAWALDAEHAADGAVLLAACVAGGPLAAAGFVEAALGRCLGRGDWLRAAELAQRLLALDPPRPVDYTALLLEPLCGLLAGGGLGPAAPILAMVALDANRVYCCARLRAHLAPLGQQIGLRYRHEELRFKGHGSVIVYVVALLASPRTRGPLARILPFFGRMNPIRILGELERLEHLVGAA